MHFLAEEPSREQLINHLYKLALEHIVMLPYAYALDAFRWDVVNNTVQPEEYNRRWWKYR